MSTIQNHKIGRNILATNIRYFRYQKGLSQEELAFRSGRSPALISDLENCKIAVSIDTIEDIAEVFGCSLSELVTDHNYKVTKNRVDGR